MAGRGRPPKPLERKLLLEKGDGQGTSHSGKELEVTYYEPMSVEVSPETGNPVPPFGLEGRGLAEWEKVWTAGRAWLHHAEDYHWVEMISRSYNDIEEFRRQISITGLTVNQGYKGLVANPLIKEVRACEASIRTCLSHLGFSPTDRAKLGLAEVKVQSGLADLQSKTARNARKKA